MASQIDTPFIKLLQLDAPMRSTLENRGEMGKYYA